MKISVIVAAYNRASMLREALLSLSSQSVPLEIILVDDGSTEGLQDLARTHGVKYFRPWDKAEGPAKARNYGLRVCAGDYVAFLDSDDRLVPHGIAVRAQYLLRHPEAGAVYGTIASVIDESGTLLGSFNHVFPNYRVPFPGTISATLFRKSFLDQVGPFDPSFSPGDDLEFMLRANRLKPIAKIKDGVYQYRIHSQNLTLEKRSHKATRPTKAQAYLLSQLYPEAF